MEESISHISKAKTTSKALGLICRSPLGHNILAQKDVDLKQTNKPKQKNGTYFKESGHCMT